MSSIDEVISRSRQPGTFSERKQFTVARANAIRKMRQFALADPHFFALELIQSALANGATYIDIASEPKFFALSYIGGGYAEQELGQLFDFLFASKSDLEHSDLRQLALGINAMMLMEPDTITVESGDGTIEGTTRAVIRGGSDVVEVGRPDKALQGTFISATKLKRAKIKHKSTLGRSEYGEAECAAIEERCLTAPVPILVNGRSMFGFARQRTPGLLGYSRVVSFDEGDLYGSIGLSTHGGDYVAFRLLTWGVWIQSVERVLLPGQAIGGVICFDRLNKTADHAAIVRDLRFEELWARLMPYAQQLISGKGRDAYAFEDLGGRPISARELRPLLREVERAVIIPHDLGDLTPTKRERALAIAQALDAPVLRGNREDLPSLRYLGGETEIVVPRLDSDEDVRFYMQAPVAPPERPWLIGEEAIAPRTIAEVARALTPAEASLSASLELARRLGGEEIETSAEDAELLATSDARVTDVRRYRLYVRPGAEQIISARGLIDATLYTPEARHGGGEEIWARVISSGRLVWEGAVHSAFPNLVLDIKLKNVSRHELLSPLDPDGEGADAALPLAEALAKHIARSAIADFQRATRRALESLNVDAVEPYSGAANMILAHIAREGLLRLRTPEGFARPRLELDLFDAPRADLLAVPVLETRAGRPVSMREIVELMRAHHGLIYGAVPEVEADLRGLRERDVLRLDLETERLIIAALGDASYVRLDARDVLAQSASVVLRDVAIGLTDYAPGPLLVEAAALPAPLAEAEIERLVIQLINRVTTTPRDAHEEECRRQALRHLQAFAIARGWTPSAEAPTYGTDALPLFTDASGWACSVAQLRAGLAAHQALMMHDGRGHDVTHVHALTPESLEAAGRSDQPVHALSMNPFVFELLARVAPVRDAFGFDFQTTQEGVASGTPEAEDPAATTAWLHSVAFEEHGYSGVLGVPEQPVESPAIALVTYDRKQVLASRPVALRYGVVGTLRAIAPDASPPSTLALQAAAIQTLDGLMDRLGALAETPERWRAAVTALLKFTASHMQLMATPDGRIVLDVRHALAQRVLDMPLFDTELGMPISAQRLLAEYCARLDLHQLPSSPLEQLPPLSRHVDPLLMRWLLEQLRPERIAQPASSSHRQQPEPHHHTSNERLRAWIDALRPDTLRLERVDICQPTSAPDTTLAAWWLAHGDAKRPFMYSQNERSGEGRLVLNGDHWLIAWSLERMAHDPQALAWLLLSSYAHINEVLEPVTNAHELVFQRHLSEHLVAGTLR